MDMIESYYAFMDRVREDPHPCEYGHHDCSDKDGGRCCDEYHSDVAAMIERDDN